MPQIAGIDQLRTLDPEAILTNSAETIWVERSTGFIRARITDSLVDARDGHLGYTQIVRLAELARFVFWRSIISAVGLEHIHDCTLVALQARFMRPICVGQVIELRVHEFCLGTTSLSLRIELYDIGSTMVTCELSLTLVALDRYGEKVAFASDRDDAQ